MNSKMKRIAEKVPGYRAFREMIKKERKFSTWDLEIVRRSFRPVRSPSKQLRLNLLILGMDRAGVFAGAQTAVDFFLCLSDALHAERRVITNGPVPRNPAEIVRSDLFTVDSATSEQNNIIVDLSNCSQPLAVRENDVFLAAFWGNAYSACEMADWFEREFKKPLPLVYLIQEYEPGFTPFSSYWLLAESTYKNDASSNAKVVAVFNSHSLREYFHLMNHQFFSEYSFAPRLNPVLRDYLLAHKDEVKRKKQILVYGRPYSNRNAFELLLMALDRWYATDPNAKDWTILSAGRLFPEIRCPSGAVIHVAGKLSLEEYAKTMLESSVGVSLMCSPHPSYPPLEMAAFGVKVITNAFVNKDLSSFSPNITSLPKCTIQAVVDALTELTATPNESVIVQNEYFEDSERQWDPICAGIKQDLGL